MKGDEDFVVALLRTSGVPDPLIGDIAEEHASGRASLWLWQQSSAAMWRTAVRDLRSHKLLGLRAVATGTATILVASAAKFSITSHSWASTLWVYWTLTLLSFLFAGWMVGRTHRQHRGAMVLAFVTYAVAAKGWLYTSHFSHYWKPQNLEQFFLDVALTCVGFVMIMVAGLLPGWHRDPLDSRGHGSASAGGQART